MVKRVSDKDASFRQDFEDAFAITLTVDTELNVVVGSILQDVSENEDKALLHYTNKFDRTKYTAADLKVTAAEIDAAYKRCDAETIAALELAAQRIEVYHKKQMPADELYTDEQGVELGWQWTAIGAVGLYVPGGTAAYPSSVLMNAIPAKVAGVENLVMVTPTPDGVMNDVVLAAAKVAGVDEIYKVGGAQAVAALAFGTKTIPRVNKIVGPGNAYVAEAKRQVFGNVGIDMIAGPSEILVIADDKNDPRHIAADLLSQAEHDVDARSVLITFDEDFADKVEAAVEKILPDLLREDIARKSWDDNGTIIVIAAGTDVENREQAVIAANKIATEHLELAVENPKEWLPKIKNAGAIFLGRHTPEAIGDYMAGPSHVLPTSGSAKFSSGLGVFDFIKRSSIIGCSVDAFDKLADATEHLAEKEGLTAHALSVSVRKS
jgi:histidinol dehydrogenase